MNHTNNYTCVSQGRAQEFQKGGHDCLDMGRCEFWFSETLRDRGDYEDHHMQLSIFFEEIKAEYEKIQDEVGLPLEKILNYIIEVHMKEVVSHKGCVWDQILNFEF